MKDFLGREIQIGDKCARYQGQLGGFEEVTVLGIDDKGVEVLNFMDKKVRTSGEKLVDISAIEREARKEDGEKVWTSADLRRYEME